MDIDRKSFQNALLRWFRSNGRSLPWRLGYDPYHVWLSEIMLQQTQMERGVAYFLRWIERFPDIDAVAAADQQEILRYWEGLGYYARARNLHRAAKVMVEQHGGLVPSNYRELLHLPGVGPYTASAVASIAFNQDIALVDANVERIFARLFDVDQPLKSKGVHAQILVWAKFLLPESKARLFNQALMDLGGLVCTPKNPDCGLCPLAVFCQAYRGDFVDHRPVKGMSQQAILIEMATGLLIKDQHIFIQQRRNDDIWGGLWEFPGGRLLADELPEIAVVREYGEETGFKVAVCCKVTTVVHFFTKYKVVLHCYLCRLDQESLLPELHAAQNYHWVKESQLDAFGFPAGHRKFISYLRKNLPEAMETDC